MSGIVKLIRKIYSPITIHEVSVKSGATGLLIVLKATSLSFKEGKITKEPECLYKTQNLYTCEKA